MPEGFHSATSSIQANPLFQLQNDLEEVKNCENVLGFYLKALGKRPLSDEQLMQIAKQAKDISKTLLEERVYSMDSDVDRTYQLMESIHADTKGGNINVYSDARSPRGYPYAGSIEYGFHPWGHSHFVPPRPFLRPALEFAINATRAGWKANVERLAYNMKYNKFELSHFGNDVLGASRRTWGSNASSHFNLGTANVANRSWLAGNNRGTYSYAHNQAYHGVQKGAYRSVWEIKDSKGG